MRPLRIALLVVAVLVASVAAPLTATAWLADRSLADSAGYAERMEQAWRTDARIRTELSEQATAATGEQVYAAFGVDGPGANFLADAAVSLATRSIDSALTSAAFTAAWGDWHEQLHRDLAAIVRGGDPQTTSVAGSTITIDGGPLIEAMLSGPLGGLADRFLDEESLLLSFDTGYDIEAQLQALGRLVSARWWALAAVAGSILAAAWLSRPHRRGAGLALLAAGAGCLAAGVWNLLPAPASTGAEQAPVLSEAVRQAWTAGWSGWLFAAALLLAAVGAALALAGRRGAEHAGAAQQPTTI